VINDVILVVLWVWVVPLVLFIFYFVTDPVPGSRWRRRKIKIRSLQPVSKILLAQKVTLVLVVGFITLVRFTGGGPWRDWMAFGLYVALAGIALAAFIDLRQLQLPQERRLRQTPERDFNP